MKVGFTIDPWLSLGQAGYAPVASSLAPQLLGVSAFLGVQAFNPEITVGACDPQNIASGDPILTHCPATGGASLNSCSGTCTDQNRTSNLASLVAWKRQWVADWVNSGVPTPLDVSPGYDGRLVFGGMSHVGIYGDNAYDGIDDRFRNGESEMKRAYASGNTLQGVVYNAWNGFAEALTATWTCPQQRWTGPGAPPSCWPITTQRSWLTDQFSVDPRYCDRLVYTNGSSDGAHVYGAICDHWQALGGSVVYNEPSTAEYGTPGGNRANDFIGGGSIYWSQTTGAREAHCAINACYKHFGADGPSSAYFTLGTRPSMGLPTSDESGTSTYRYNAFQSTYSPLPVLTVFS